MFSFKSKTKLLLAIDVSTSGVKAVVFWAHKNEKPEILKTFKSDASLLPEVSFLKLQKGIHKALGDVLKNIHESFHDKINGVFVSLDSPWYYSQTRIIDIKHNTPFELTKEFLAKALKKEEKTIKSKSEEKFKIKGSDLSVLEKYPMRSFLNGYGVKNIFGKKVKRAELYIYMSVVLKKLVTDVEGLIKNELGVEDVHFHTSPLIMFDMLDGVADKDSGFLLINVGEEITDVVLVHKGYLEEVVSFPRGGNFVLRRIASVFKISPDEALSHLSMQSRKHLNKKDSEKLDEVMVKAGGEWGDLFEKALKHLHKTAPIPTNAFIFGSSAVLNIFLKAAGAERFSELIAHSIPLSVKKLLPETLKEKYKFGDAFKSHQDTTTLFLALFFNKHVWQKEQYQ